MGEVMQAYLFEVISLGRGNERRGGDEMANGKSTVNGDLISCSKIFPSENVRRLNLVIRRSQKSDHILRR